MTKELNLPKKGIYWKLVVNNSWKLTCQCHVIASLLTDSKNNNQTRNKIIVYQKLQVKRFK